MKHVFFTTTTVLCLLFAGCARESEVESQNASPGSLRITIQNSANNSSTRAVGTPTQVEENVVQSFAVFVFHNASGELERMEQFTNVLSGVIEDLSTASSKKIVVLTNYNFTLLSAVRTYDELTAQRLTIETQNPTDFSTEGLFMSGESSEPVSLSATESNSITIPVSRVVAKVQLGNLFVSPDAEYSLDNFVLNGVSMQRVPYYANMLGDEVAVLESTDYSGGIAGTQSSRVLSFLSESLAIPENYTAGEAIVSNVYFYVFPNDDSQGSATLLTISGTYNGAPMYYTFPINDQLVSGGTDGTYIKRNMIYTLNITLRKLGLGADDADSKNELADLEVVFDVSDWVGDLIHNLEW